MSAGFVTSVSRAKAHTFHKSVCVTINLLQGLGVEGDAHCGITVQHRSRIAANPSQPNLRQVHLIHNELLEDLNEQGFSIGPGDLGENILTNGIDLSSLPTDTLLKIGTSARIKVTGLRNPCAQIESFKQGLLEAVLVEDLNGNIYNRAGIMGIVVSSGLVSVKDPIEVTLPPLPHRQLERV